MWLRLIIASLLLSISIMSLAQKKTIGKGKYGDGPDSIPPVSVLPNLTDDQLLDVVQKQTLRFFWHGAHPVSGLALERDNTVRAEYYWDYINESGGEPNLSKSTFGPDAGAIGGTGFGIMSIIVGVNRGWIGRDTAVRRLMKIADFLTHADCYHGIYPHFMNGRTGKAIPFDRLDDAADLVETSYLMMGFLCAREYFDRDTPAEKYLRNRIAAMWGAANWNWHTNNKNMLFWHWSPNNGFDMNFPIRGWNECLITYIIAASSPNHGINRAAYDTGWIGSTGFKNGDKYYGYTLPLGNYGKDKGGPLFL